MHSKIICFSLLVLLIAGCGSGHRGSVGTPGAAQEPHAPLTVRLEGGDWGYPTPFAHYSRGPGSAKMRYIFDSLLERDEKGNIPWLAESYAILDGGTRYLFRLRPGINWQDGQPLTAHDVVFSLEYYRQHPPVSTPAGLTLEADYLLGIKARSDLEVELEVAYPRSTFLEAVGRLPIIPAHIWAQVDDPQNFAGPEAVIGSGPFRLESYSKEHGIYRFVANEQFWGPPVQVDILEFIPVSEPVLALEKGDIDLAEVPADTLSRFRGNAAFTLKENPAFWGYRLCFNMERVPAFRQRELRRAFAYAINRDELVEKIARGLAVPGNPGILSPHHRWYNPDVYQYPYNPGRARELLAGIALSGPFELLVGEGREVRIGELLREQLAQVGIELRVVSLDLKSRDARLAEGSYQLALVGHGGWGGDPDYLRTRFAGKKDWFSGTPGYENAEVARLAAEQLKETDEKRRRELVFALQELLADDVPEIPLFLTTGYTVFRHGTYGGWRHVFDHHAPTHNKISFLAGE